MDSIDWDHLAKVAGRIHYGGTGNSDALIDNVNPENTRIDVVSVNIDMHDGRDLELDLDRDGFEVLNHHSEVATAEDIRERIDEYHAEMCAMIATKTGAKVVVPKRSYHRMEGGNKPVVFAHVDYDRAAAEDLLAAMIERDGLQDVEYSEWAVYQTWRVTSPPPHDNLLAIADPRSVNAGEWDAVKTITGPADIAGNVFNSLISRPSSQHRWVYFPNMTPDSVLMWKGYHSNPEKNVGIVHSGFDIPPTEGVMQHRRRSVETRFVALF